MKTKMFAFFLLAALIATVTVPVSLNKVYAQTSPPANDVYTLTLTTNATGCSATANLNQTTYQYNETVQLTPVAAPGYTFSSWSGDVNSTDNPLTVYMVANITINALFTQNTYNLTVYTVGDGSVTPKNATYTYDQVANLTATPAQGWSFQSWSNGNTSSTVSVSMTSNENLTATFVQNPTPTATPTSSPIPTATATPSPTATIAPTPPPAQESAILQPLVIATLAAVILVALCAGLLYQRKKARPRKKSQIENEAQPEIEI